MKPSTSFFRKHIFEVVLLLVLFGFSFWLMFSTFSYSGGEMRIATKAWSDFASHIPLIRSFSFGTNIPVEFPLFPGEPIRYHYLFFLLVGLLERGGLPIDLALNIPSALGFFSLTALIYFLGAKLFQNRAVGVLSVVFFLCNGSFSFLEFFKDGHSLTTVIPAILTNETFPSFGPYDGKIVSAFWNLNIYTNQRHLPLALGLFVGLIFTIVFFQQKNQKIPIRIAIATGLCIGILSFLHSGVFLMSIAVLCCYILLFSHLRKSLILTLVTSLFVGVPRIAALSGPGTFSPIVDIGFLAQKPLTISNLFFYWYMNLGLFLFFIPAGFLLSKKLAKKIFIGIFSLFVIGNTIQFSIELAGNHKFFNAFLIVGNMYAAFFLVTLWGRKVIFRPLVIFFILLMTLSGIIDLFPIKNDRMLLLNDAAKNKEVAWIKENTPPNAIFLNSTYLYNPASVAGRKIFLGWPYFAWSHGYDTLTRDTLRKDLLHTNDKAFFCRETKKYNLTHIQLVGQSPDIGESVKSLFFDKNFSKKFSDDTTGTVIYAITSCS